MKRRPGQGRRMASRGRLRAQSRAAGGCPWSAGNCRSGQELSCGAQKNSVGSCNDCPKCCAKGVCVECIDIDSLRNLAVQLGVRQGWQAG